MQKKIKVYCPYSVLDLEWKTLKNLQNITFEKPWYLFEEEQQRLKEKYGTNKIARKS